MPTILSYLLLFHRGFARYLTIYPPGFISSFNEKDALPVGVGRAIVPDLTASGTIPTYEPGSPASQPSNSTERKVALIGAAALLVLLVIVCR